jgi:predicted nucleic acid-binding protein
MDVCCFNRPFDDLMQDKIYHESEAVLSILKKCKKGDYTLISSDIIDIEFKKIKDLNKLEKVNTLYQIAKQYFPTTTEAEKRAKFFQGNGLKLFDSYHLAVAETNEADVFLTTDDKFFKTANRLRLGIKVSNPLLWLTEVTNSGE